MRIDLFSYSILALSCILSVPALAQVHHPHDDLKPERKPNLAYEWMDVALEATARDTEHHGARPPIGARQLAIVATAMFDAWAAYDDKAVGNDPACFFQFFESEVFTGTVKPQSLKKGVTQRHRLTFF